MAASITVVIAFVMFMGFEDEVGQMLVRMMALELMAFGGTVVGIYLGTKNPTAPTNRRGRDERRTNAAS